MSSENVRVKLVVTKVMNRIAGSIASGENVRFEKGSECWRIDWISVVRVGSEDRGEHVRCSDVEVRVIGVRLVGTVTTDAGVSTFTPIGGTVLVIFEFPSFFIQGLHFRTIFWIVFSAFAFVLFAFLVEIGESLVFDSFDVFESLVVLLWVSKAVHSE